MSADTNPAASPTVAPPGAVRKGRKVLWTLAAAVAVIAACGWIGLGLTLYLDAGRQVRLVAAVVAAVASEGAFWLSAAALGVSVFEARKRIWRRITGRG